MNNNKENYDIKLLCKIIQLPRSIYYYHIKNTTNSYKEENKKLDVQILKIYSESNKRYGSPKIKKVLKSKGIKVSQKRVARRMRFLNIRSIVIKKFKPTHSKNTVDDKDKPNLLKQEFETQNLREKLVSDITYIY